MMTLRHMEVFHAIMVTGSVTGAARLLNITQPAISAVLKHCESRLNMKLFLRAGGRLQPTEEALAIFPDVAAIFGRVDAVGRLAQDLVGGKLGTLSVAAAFPIANGYLAKAMASFLVERPKVRCTLQSLTSPQVLDRVINREVELGLAHEPIISNAVDTEELMSWSLNCVMPEDHPLVERDEIDVRDLAPYPIITYQPQIVFRPYVDRAFSQAGIAPTIAVQVSIALTGIMLARFGAGVAIVDSQLVDSMGIPGLAVRELTPRIEAKTLLIQPKDAPRSVVVNEFIGHLRKVIREDGV
ncbi:DNA-binding transcriptional LysR family regulator [Mycoplana sp. BE70]|uniref:LysR family transcriptional regulator n=1 Tax=Mycoplana sp. BE70 TaxID=2817775 RepID=UPI00285B1A53|nr:LysR family transcriptional regulator [Mycoplana sp. BE70]MDR6756419.1 DNA-binding transcriptional LysR family regulator [Mycoplana sp. BE70]